MGTEALDPDLLCRLGNDSPDRPVTQTLPHFADLVHGAKQRASFDLRCILPGVDPNLDPDGDGDGADAAALAAEVEDDPAVSFC